MTKPDITLEDAIKKTKDAGFVLNYQRKETIIAADIFELKKDIEQSKLQVKNIHWIFAVVIIALLMTVLVILSDYFQFLSHTYKNFDETIKNEKVNQNDMKSIKTDIESIKQNLELLSE